MADWSYCRETGRRSLRPSCWQWPIVRRPSLDPGWTWRLNKNIATDFPLLTGSSAPSLPSSSRDSFHAHANSFHFLFVPGEDISTSPSHAAAMLGSALRLVTRSHRPHYANPDTCEAFARLFVLVCRRTPPVPPIKATYDETPRAAPPKPRVLWRLCKAGFGMDLRTYCMGRSYKVHGIPDVKCLASEKVPILSDICISHGNRDVNLLCLTCSLSFKWNSTVEQRWFDGRFSGFIPFLDEIYQDMGIVTTATKDKFQCVSSEPLLTTRSLQKNPKMFLGAIQKHIIARSWRVGTEPNEWLSDPAGVRVLFYWPTHCSKITWCLWHHPGMYARLLGPSLFTLLHINTCIHFTSMQTDAFRHHSGPAICPSNLGRYKKKKKAASLSPQMEHE